MGVRVGTTVSLGVRNPETGETSVRSGVSMTGEKRAAIWEARRRREAGPTGATAGQPAPVTNVFDVWLYDAESGALERVAAASGSGRESIATSVSADGRRVVFHSDSDFNGEGNPNGTDEIWMYDVEARSLSRITQASDPERDSRNPSISADGSVIAFESTSDFLGEGIGASQREIWVYQVVGGTLERLTRSPSGSSMMAAISGDGSKVAFASNAPLDGGSAETAAVEIWLADVASGALTRVTRSPIPQRQSIRPALDASGSRVVFESDAWFDGRGVTGRGQMDIWLYDVASAALTRVTEGGDGTRASEAASISADGTKIVFHSDADLQRDGHPDSVDEIWMYEVQTRSLERLTHTWQPLRDAGKNAVLHPDTQYPHITRDGSKVVFASDADYLSEGLANGFPNVWILDLASRDLTRVDTRAGSGSGLAIDAFANRIALFRSDFDAIRNARVGAGPIVAASSTPRPTSLTGAQIAQDLDALLGEMEGRWAYLKANGVDYRSAVAALRERGANGMSFNEYGLEVQKIIAMFIDGHSAVGGFITASRTLPFMIEMSGDRLVAVHSDRSAFLDAEHPVITHLDGRPVADWLQAASTFVPKASPQWTRRNALSWVGRVQFMRGVMGIPAADSVTVQMASEDGARTRRLTLPIQASSPRAPQPRMESGLIDGNVGYLRLALMNDDAVDEVETWMPRFRETRGLIVDVRGNGGGSRDALRALFPYLMSATDAPRVVNAAKYRLHSSFGEDHLGGSRYMYRDTASEWTPEERAAIERFKQTFVPQWVPPTEEFSDWHYLVMSRKTNPNAYEYDRPVIILLDQDSFSATDIFVSAFKGWPGVTLVGTPSGGGSARQLATRLPVSGLSVNLASMASFQLDGRLHDGNGTQPDVLVPPEPGYFLVGGRDNVLERALELLRPRP
jgi:Tol biopolymer transport system component